MSTLERKKKNFSFTRKFPFMKSRDNIDDASEGERKKTHFSLLNPITCVKSPPLLTMILCIPCSINVSIFSTNYYLIFWDFAIKRGYKTKSNFHVRLKSKIKEQTGADFETLSSILSSLVLSNFILS